MVMPYLLVSLNGEFGLRGAFLISGGLVLHTVPCVYSMALFNLNNSPVIISHEPDVNRTHRKILNRLREFGKGIHSLCRNEQYLMGPACIAFGTAILSLLVFLVVDVLIAKGLAKTDGVFALFLMGLFSLFGRIMPGLFKLCHHTSTSITPIIIYVVSGISFILLPSATDPTLIFVLTSAVGLSFGASISSIYAT